MMIRGLVKTAAAVVVIQFLTLSGAVAVVMPAPGDPASVLYQENPELPAELNAIGRLLRDGKRDEARTRLEAFIAREPAHGTAFEMQGTILMEEGQQQAAETALRRALELDPQNAGANAKLGVLLLQKGDVKGGREHLMEALAIDPGNGYAQAVLGNWAAEHGNSNAAINHYRVVVHVLDVPAGTLTPYHIALATEYNRSGRYAESRAVLAGRISDGVPEEARVPALLADTRASLGLGDEPGAQHSLDRLAHLLPKNNPDLVVLQSALLQNQGKTSEAVKRLKSAVGDDPGANKTLHLALARIYGKQKKWGAAEGELVAALDASAGGSDTPDILKKLATVLVNGRRVDDAKRILASNAQRYPQYPDIALTLASLEASTGDHQGALRRLDGLARMHPDRADIQDLRGQLLFMQGRRDEGLAALRQATQLAPANIDHWMMLSQMAEHTGGPKAQVKVLEDAVTANPQNPDLYYDLALVYGQLGRKADARVAAQSALSYGLAGPPADKARALIR